MKFKRITALLLAVMMIAFDLSAAMLTVDAASSADYTPGDLNSDGIINTTDVVSLRRYIAGGYNVTVNLLAGDVNADGIWNTTDVVMIRRYIAGGYNVTLKPAPGTEPECQHTETVLPAVTPTCTASGLTEGKKCATCGEILVAQTVIPATGHTEEIIPAVAPTCIEVGLTEGKKCVTCGEILVAQLEIAMLSHVSGEYVGIPPTCTQPGFSSGTKCVLCDTVLIASNPIPATGHKEETIPGKTETCTETGLTEGKKCATCGEILVAQQIIPALGHSYGEWYVTKEPTETAAGEKRRDCVNCDTFETTTVAALAHDHNRWDKITLEAVAPTCTATGLTEGSKCAGCGEILVAQQTVAALGHRYMSAFTPPTATEDGYTTFTCSSCGHSYAEAVPPISFEITRSNRSKIGFTGTTGEELIIPAVFKDGQTWYRVTSIGDDAFYGCRSLTSVTIPDSVTSIGNSAFCECTKLTSVIIGDSVTSIDDYAFDRCSSLTAVTIGDSVTSIGIYAFSDCSSLTSVTIPDSVTSMGFGAFMSCSSLISVTIPDSVTSMGDSMFSGCSALTSITISDNVTRIGDSMFWGCSNLISITIPDSVTSIGSTAFYECSSLTSIILPDGVTSIGSAAFSWCSSLTSVTIPDSVTSIGSAAFSDCSSLTSVTIPDGVTCISDSAFWGCNSLTLAIIPESVTGIDKGAFYNCSSLTSVTIPNSVTSFGEKAFYYCKSLTDIYFTGTETQWNAITKGNLWDYRIPDHTIHFNYDPNHIHAEIIVAAVSPTCTTTGLTEGKKCVTCGEILVEQQTVPMLAHIEEIIIGNDATCSVPGLTEGKHCSVCGEILIAQQIIPAKGHVEVIDTAVAATCTTTGLTEGKHCSVCGEIFVVQQVVAALGHNYGEWVVTKEPTETDAGEKRRDCVNCDAFETTTVAALTHDHNRWDKITLEAVAPTCTATGLTEGSKCSGCGEILIAQQIIPAKGHVEVIDTAVAATCTTTGLTEGKHCSVCGEILVAQQIIPAKGHVEVIDATVAATCTTTGLTEGKHCFVCGEILVAQQIIPAKGHVEVIDAAVVPTCTTTGLTEGKHCSVCSAILIPQEIIDVRHAEVIDKAVPPTCTTTGLTEGKHCSLCQKVLIQQEVVPAQHSYENGVCTVCDKLQPTAEEYFYCSPNNDGTCSIYVANPSVLPTHVVIPESVYGYTVTGIRADGFSGCTQLKSVYIPECVTTIGNYAFYKCSSLTSVNIPIGVTSIEYSTFEGCSNLASVQIPDSVTKIGSRAFVNCHSLTDIHIPSGVTKINSMTFYGCESLISVEIPDGVTYIDYQAFDGCSNLTFIHIPSSVTGIANNAFSRCARLKNVYITDIEKWCYMDYASSPLASAGNLYLNGELVTKIAIPEGVTYIRDGLFRNCSSLYSVTIPEGVTSIGDEAFYGCSNLFSPTIPGTVTSIGTGAFSSCPALVRVKYNGTKEQWNAISKGSEWNRNQLGNPHPSAFHLEVIAPAVAATCTTSGLTEGTYCLYCNNVMFAQQTIAALGHSFGEWVVTKEPTETAAGEKRRDCTNCDEFETAPVAALAHDHNRWDKITLEAVAPTCTATGLTEGSKCSGCGEILVAQQIIPALGHTEVIHVAVAPTCTETGLTESKYCSVCNETLVAQQIIPATGHNEVVDAAVASTCTESGLTEGTHCAVCGEVLIKQMTVPAKGHAEVLDVAVVPTCTQTGLTVGTHCSVCNEVLIKQETVPALGHTEVIDAAVAATCTATGLTEGKHCSVCSEILVAQQIIPAKGHVEVIDPAVAATCTKTGLTEGKHCSVCGEVLIAQETVPAKGHTQKISESGLVPTCTEAGYTDTIICSACSHIFQNKTLLHPTGHNYADNVCQICRHTLVPSSGLAFRVLDDGNYSVAGIGECIDTDIVIPANYNGKDVISIDDSAFFESKKITGIYIPSSIATIGARALSNTTLNVVYMEEGVKAVGQSAFASDYGTIKLMVIPSTLSDIGTEAFMCGARCVILDNEVIAKSENADAANGYLLHKTRSVLIRTGMDYGSYVAVGRSCQLEATHNGKQYIAFTNHTDHHFEAYSPFGMTEMSCTGCSCVSDVYEKEWDVSSTNSDHVTAKIYRDGNEVVLVLSGNGYVIDYADRSGGPLPWKMFNPMITKIVVEDGICSIPSNAFVLGESLTSVSIPDSVISIGKGAFSSCENLTAIDLPNGLTVLNERTFQNCWKLERIVLPTGVKRIGNFAFSYCYGLKLIEIPNTVTDIGMSAFEGCRMNFIRIPDGVTSILGATFQNCLDLTAIVIPANVKSIGYNAFTGVNKLETIYYGGSAGEWSQISVDKSNNASLEQVTIYYYIETQPMVQGNWWRYVDGVPTAWPPHVHTEVIDMAVTPTCTTTGLTEGKHCSVCAEILVAQEIVPAISEHSYEYTVNDPNAKNIVLTHSCSVCGDTYTETITPTNVTITSNNRGKIGYTGEAGENLVIPAIFKDNGSWYKVVSIGELAFDGCKNLASVTIPESVTSIGTSAFRSCSNAIQIENGVSYVDKWVVDCDTSVTSVVLRDNTVGIGSDAFTGCDSLTKIVIPDNVTRICSYAFYYCSKLADVTIGNSVTSIGKYAFYACDLTNITIPDSVTSIGMGAFTSCSELTALTIGNGVTTIGNGAFQYCSALTRIIIGSSVTTIDNYAFDIYNSNLKVYYVGTSEDWKNITVGSSNYGITKAAPYYYSETQPSTTCTSCWHYVDDIPTLYAHIVVVDEAVSPTCTETGLTEGKHCSACGNIIVAQKILSALGHKKEVVIPTDAVYTVQNSTTYPFSISGNQITSTNKSHNSSSTYTITALKPFTLELQYKVSSEAGYDELIIKHNSITQITASGTSLNYFRSISISMQAGDKVTITYSKDSSDRSGSDCAWVKIITSAIGVDITEPIATITEINRDSFASCTEDVLCDVCGEVAIEKVAHTEVIDVAVAPTCGANGFTEGKHCSRCGEVFVAQEVIPATGAHVFGEWNTTKAPTTKEEGLMERVCVCGASETKTIEKIIPELVYALNADGQSYSVTGIGTWDNEILNISSTHNNLPITGIRAGAFKNCSLLTSIVIPNSVTSIGNNAFYGCSKLKTVNIPVKVTSIEESTFYNCSSLTTINIPNNVTSIGDKAFYGCSSLKTINIPDNVTSIGDFAFDGCNSLSYNQYGNAYYLGNSTHPYIVLMKATSTSITSCTIHSTTKVAYHDAFSGCSSLTKVYVSNLAAWCNIDFKYQREREDGETYYYCSSNPLSYAKNLYVNSSLVTKLVIPEGVTEIKPFVFLAGSNFTSITLPSTLTKIGLCSFRSCSGLAELVIPEGVTHIDRSAFSGCSKLESVTIPKTLTAVGDYAFSSCSKLSAVHIRDLAAWCNIDFEYESDYDEGWWYDCGSNPLRYAHNLYLNGKIIVDLVIPNGVTSLAPFAFYGGNFTSVTLPDGIKSISLGAFKSCSQMTNITIPDSVTRIGSYAFNGCSKLSVLVMNKVSSIGDYAFSGGIQAIYSINPPEISTHPDDGNSFYISKIVTGYTCVTIDNVVYGVKDGEAMLVQYPANYVGGYEIPSGITVNGQEYPVTKIGTVAFADCTQLTKIVIPETVTSIGSDAFKNCTALQQIVVSGSNEAYASVDGVLYTKDYSRVVLVPNDIRGTITISSGIESIYSGDFSNRANLEGVVVSDTVTSISGSSFMGCTSLKSITVNSGNTVYTAKNNCIIDIENQMLVAICENSVLPTDGSITRIGSHVFNGFTTFTHLVIPNGVTTIDANAFYNCIGLESIVLPESVNTIGQSAFGKCTALTSITIPASVTTISYSTFSGCTNLASVTFAPNSQLQSINESAFGDCTNLTSITLPATVNRLYTYAFLRCSNLATINYEGTTTQRNSISKGTYWKSSAPVTFVTCSDGQVAI